MRPNVFFLVTAATLSMASSAAVTSTWTGAHDNNYFDLRNWDVGPREWGVLRFTNSVNIVYNTAIDDEYKITNKSAGGDAYPYGTTWLLETEGITVVFEKGASHYVVSATPTVDVARDSLLVVSNAFALWTSGGKFWKKGAGTWRMYGNMSGFNDRITVAEGKLEFVQVPGGQSCGLGSITNVIVKSGAEVNFVGNPLSHPASTCYKIETNGVLRLTSASGNAYSKDVASLSGEGNVIADGTASSTLSLTLSRQSELFTGRVLGSAIVRFTSENNADGGKRFIVSRADTFKDVRVRWCGALAPLAGVEGVEFIADGDSSCAGTILRLEDSAGNPYDYSLRITNAPTLYIRGRGNLEVKPGDGNVVLDGSRVSFEGALIAGDNASVQLGNNQSATDFDLSSASTLTALVTRASSKLTIKPNAAAKRDVAVPVRGCGKVYLASTDMTVRRLEMTGAGKVYSFMTSFKGGDATLTALEPYTAYANAGKETVVDGARITAGEARGAYSQNELPTPVGVTMVGNQGSFNFAVNSGEFAYDSGNGWKQFTMRGGRTWWTKSSPYYSDNGNVVFDGGEAVLDLKPNRLGFYFLRSDKAGHTNYITRAGGRLTAVNGGFTAYVYVNGRIYAADPGEASGELSFYGQGRWHLNHPLCLTGPIHFRDGVACVPVKALNGTTRAFGTGELRLTDSELWFDSDWTSSSPLLQVDARGYDGIAAIRFRYSEDTSGLKASEVVVGSLRRMGQGAALVLRERDALLGDGTHSSFKVTSGVANDGTAGFYRDQPVFMEDSTTSYFVKYDATAGFQRVSDDDIATDTSASTKDSLLKFMDSVTIPANTVVRAAGAKHYKSYNVTTTIGAGGTLRLGDDVHPGMFLYSAKGVLKGAGALDFGDSEGVVVVSYTESGNCTEGRSCNLLCSEVRGNNGLSYVGYLPTGSDNRRIRVGAHGRYAGDTSIAGCTVVPLEADAFSSGKVIVKPGERRGGRVRIMNELTLANDFEVGGLGCGDGDGLGAVTFYADAGISGNMMITDLARIAAYGGARGALSGSISGGRLEAYTAKADSGTIALTGANTHTGGTEVVYATLAVDKAEALGTGEVVLNGGTLRFENAASTTLTNDLRGIGSIQLAGGEVKFRCDTHRVLNIGLDFPGTRVRLTELPEFVSGITNSSSRVARLTLGGGNAFAIDPSKFPEAFKLTLEAGATLDLGGETLTVRSFSGDRSAVIGTIVETNPEKGMLLSFY